MPTTDDGQIRVHETSDRMSIAVAGRVTMHHSPAFWGRASSALEAGNGVSVNLSQCTYMDSTFLGTLLRLSRLPAAKAGATAFALVAPSASSRTLLTHMGIDRAIPIVESEPDVDPNATDWQPLDLGPSEQMVIQETVVHAHQQLAEASGPGSQQFKAIAAKLAKAWEAEKAKKP